MNEKRDEKNENRGNTTVRDYSRYESYQTEDNGYVIYDGENPRSYIKVSEVNCLVDVEEKR